MNSRPNSRTPHAPPALIPIRHRQHPKLPEIDRAEVGVADPLAPKRLGNSTYCINDIQLTTGNNNYDTSLRVCDGQLMTHRSVKSENIIPGTFVPWGPKVSKTRWTDILLCANLPCFVLHMRVKSLPQLSSNAASAAIASAGNSKVVFHCLACSTL